ncbi:MAG TPA: hypothetical protein VIW28_03420, partial [Gemmatimonadales bacterium]
GVTVPPDRQAAQGGSTGYPGPSARGLTHPDWETVLNGAALKTPSTAGLTSRDARPRLGANRSAARHAWLRRVG